MKKKKIKKIIVSPLKKIAGIILILVGILGLFLPFLQGVVMIVAGVILLGDRRLSNWLKHKLDVFKRYFRKK